MKEQKNQKEAAPVPITTETQKAPSKRRESLMQSSRPTTTTSKAAPKQQCFDDLSKVLFVESNILNCSSIFPGKLLGSTLTVGNLTNCEQIVELAVDATSYTFNKKQIISKWKITKEVESNLPFTLTNDQHETNGKKPSETIVNSVIKHEAWYIENPISKELTKRITLKLGPKAEQEFIIVVRRAPPKTLRRAAATCSTLLTLVC
jgi:hypothetical protein